MDRHFAQPRVKLAAVANVMADCAPAACCARAMHQRAEQIDRTFEQILIVRRKVRSIEIRHPCHGQIPLVYSPLSREGELSFSTARTDVSGMMSPPRWRLSVS